MKEMDAAQEVSQSSFDVLYKNVLLPTEDSIY